MPQLFSIQCVTHWPPVFHVPVGVKKSNQSASLPGRTEDQGSRPPENTYFPWRFALPCAHRFQEPRQPVASVALQITNKKGQLEQVAHLIQRSCARSNRKNSLFLAVRFSSSLRSEWSQIWPEYDHARGPLRSLQLGAFVMRQEMRPKEGGTTIGGHWCSWLSLIRIFGVSAL